MQLSIIGSGHVGLVTGACFAEKGHDVLCTDSDAEKIEGLKQGTMPFHEPGLEAMVRRNAEDGRLRFSDSVAEAVTLGQAVFISVWTPPLPSGRADLSYVEKVSREIAENLPENEHRLVVEKSTVPVRTGERVLRTIERFAPKGRDYDVASNPEFLREGTAIRDTMEPDRIVIGADSEKARALLERIYKGFPGERVFCDVRSAEMIKHASNAFLASKISFINAVARVCEKSGADIELVARGMGLDPRIAPSFLKAGIGYGGSCFPKDVSAFIDIARELGYEFRLLEEVQRINREMRFHFVDRVEKELWNLRDKPVAVLGLAFKPDTDDMRLAPSVTIIEELLKRGAHVRAFDPVTIPRAREAMQDLQPQESLAFCNTVEDACKGAEAVLLVTEWPEIVGADWKKLRTLVASPTLFDGRNALDRAELQAAGWTVNGVGTGQ